MDDDRGSGPLFDAGVLASRGGEVTATERFEARVAEYETEAGDPDADDVGEAVRERVEAGSIVEPLVGLCLEDPRSLAELCALEEYLSPVADDWLAYLPVLRLFRPDGVATDGVPESFVPVAAEVLPHLTSVYSPSLVYVWLEDCPPCDAVKEHLEAAFERPRAVQPFAVYGPAHAEFLTETYDVTGGPALLFMRDGEVESRLYGDYGERVVESELERLIGDS